MSTDMLKYILYGAIGLFVLIIIAYVILNKKLAKSEYRQIKKLQQGTRRQSFSMEIFYQKAYITCIRIPFIKRYLYKLRRRIEIINIDDEYATRRDATKI